jgi:hypothetical protein
MLEEISVRQQKLGLSTRKFAEQLDVSPTLLSLVLNKKRAISGDLTVRSGDGSTHLWQPVDLTTRVPSTRHSSLKELHSCLAEHFGITVRSWSHSSFGVSIMTTYDLTPSNVSS